MATGKKEKNLAQKYQKAEEAAKKKNINQTKKSTKTSSKTGKSKTSTKPKKKTKQQSSIKSVPKKKKHSLYWIIVEFFSLIAFGLVIYLLLK